MIYSFVLFYCVISVLFCCKPPQLSTHRGRVSLLTLLHLIPLSYHYRRIISTITPRAQNEQNGQGEAVAINSRFVAKTNPPPVCSSFGIYSVPSSKDINEIWLKYGKQTIPIPICLKVLPRSRIVVRKR